MPRTPGQFIDKFEKDNEVKKNKKQIDQFYSLNTTSFFVRERDCNFIGNELKLFETLKCKFQVANDSLTEKEKKSERRMPRLPVAKKDAVSCEKLRGSANRI